jgi:hypothetical protein
MTLLIRDAGVILFRQWLLIARVSGAHSIFVCALLLIVSSSATAAAPFKASQDPNAKPAPAPSAQQTPAASSNAVPRAPTESTPLQKAVRQKKVITEEDLAKPSKAISLSDLEGEENNPTCDLSCEAELRERMGFGPEREAEFRNQLTLARHEIGDDKVWTSTLQSALEAAAGYCDVQRRKAQILGKGVVSQYVRDDLSQRFADRQGKFVSQYRNSSGLLTQRIHAVQRFAPFRATIMQYQVSEATTRVCPDYTLP